MQDCKMELKSMHNQLIYKLLFTAILSLQKRRNKIFICKINNLNLYSQVFLKQYLSYIQNNQIKHKTQKNNKKILDKNIKKIKRWEKKKEIIT